MRLAGLLLLSLLISLETPAFGQLPDSFKGWETKSSNSITAKQLGEFAGSDAPLVREYGFVSGEHREYAKGDAGLSANLWKMKDASGSFGLFTLYREIGSASMESGDRIAIWPDRLLIQHGPYLLDSRGTKLSKNLTVGEAKLLLGKIPGINSQEAVLPPLPGFLPEENMIPQSSKFMMGPLAFGRIEQAIPSSAIGFDQGAEAEEAQYKLGAHTVRLLLVSYATPQMASKRLRVFQQLPAIAQNQGSIALDRKGPLLCLVLDATETSAAQALLNNVRYESEVTWNQHVPTRRDNIANLIMGVFLLAGFVLLFALVAGLSYGGLRVLAKKFLPIPVFDRPSQVEIIRLHLSDQ